MKGGYKKTLNAFSYPTTDANESSASPGDQANDAINNDNAKNLALIQLTEGTKKNINLKQLGGKAKNKNKNKNKKGGGRTINVPKELPVGQIPGPSFNGALTIGEKCVGGHCAIPVDPLTSNFTNNNLKSANPPLKGTFHYQGTNRLGNSQLKMPGVEQYIGTKLNNGSFNILATGGGRKKRKNKNKNKNKKGGGRTINVPKKLPSGQIPKSSYNSAVSIGEKCIGNHCAISVNSTTSNLTNNNLQSANPPRGALNHYQGTDRLGNSTLSMSGVNQYIGTTLNNGPFNILATGGGCSTCNSPYEAILSGGGYYSKIVNPETGRKVSIFGKLGQRVLGNYLKNL
jgi:hypothetical protein